MSVEGRSLDYVNYQVLPCFFFLLSSNKHYILLIGWRIYLRAAFIGNRPFYRCGGHIEFIRFMEYYGMPRGHSLSILHRLFGQNENFNDNFYRQKGDHYYIQKGYDDLFFPFQSLSRKT